MIAGVWVKVGTRVDPFGRETSVKFGDVNGSAPLTYAAIVLIFFSLFLMRHWPPRSIAWVATVVSAWAFLYAVNVRIDPTVEGVASVGVPLRSGLNLEVLAGALCVVGSLVCLRADGPVFGKRRDKVLR